MINHIKPISEEMKHWLNKATDAEWEGDKVASDIAFKEYYRLKALHDAGQPHEVMF